MLHHVDQLEEERKLLEYLMSKRSELPPLRVVLGNAVLVYPPRAPIVLPKRVEGANYVVFTSDGRVVYVL